MFYGFCKTRPRSFLYLDVTVSSNHRLWQPERDDDGTHTDPIAVGQGLRRRHAPAANERAVLAAKILDRRLIGDDDARVVA